MNIVQELISLRDKRLRVEKVLLKSVANGQRRTLQASDLVQLEALHDEVEELQELVLHYLYKNSPQS